MFEMESLKGQPLMLSFFRFASCPFCNMRVHALVARFNEFGQDFTVVAVFDSPIDNLIRHVAGHQVPFPILADEYNQYYREYGIKHSFGGIRKGMFFRMPTLLKDMFNGYLPVSSKAV